MYTIQAFNEIDADGSGFIEATEIKALLEGIGLDKEEVDQYAKVRQAYNQTYIISTLELVVYLFFWGGGYEEILGAL